MQEIGDSNIWNNVLALYVAETNPQERSKLMRSLAAIPDQQILTDFIQLGKDESIIREQDFWSLLSYVANNRLGEQPVWDFYRLVGGSFVSRDVLGLVLRMYFTTGCVSASRDVSTIVYLRRNEWDYLVGRFTLNDRSFGKCITSITDRFNTQQRLDEMNAFFAANPEAGAGEQYRTQALEQVCLLGTT